MCGTDHPGCDVPQLGGGRTAPRRGGGVRRFAARGSPAMWGRDSDGGRWWACIPQGWVSARLRLRDVRVARCESERPRPSPAPRGNCPFSPSLGRPSGGRRPRWVRGLRPGMAQRDRASAIRLSPRARRPARRCSQPGSHTRHVHGGSHNATLRWCSATVAVFRSAVSAQPARSR